MKRQKICLICFEPLDKTTFGKICQNCWDKKDIREAEENEE